MRYISGFIIFILFSFFDAEAQKKSIHKMLPDHVKVQFAGNIGVLSTGIGYSFLSDRIQSDILYGFAPASLTGNSIHTISNKNTFRLLLQPVSGEISMTFSVGLSLNYSITNNTFITLPEYFSDNYYFPNAVHFAPFLSSNFIYKNENVKILKNINVYFEVGTVDVYMWDYIKTRTVDFTDIWNLAIGIIIPIIKKN